MQNEVILEPSEKDILEIAEEFNAKAKPGGIRLSLEGDSYVFAPVFPLPSTDPKTLITLFGENIGLPYDSVVESMGGYEKTYKQAYEFFIEGGDLNYGFVGVTDRNMDWFKEHNNAKLDVLRKVYGTVVFVGNGLSVLPLELLKENQSIKKVILVDMIDVNYVEQQLNELVKVFESRGLHVPQRVLSRLNAAKLILTSKSDEVQIEQRTFGYNQPSSPSFGTANFVINLYGPPVSTEAEQRLYLDTSEASSHYVST